MNLRDALGAVEHSLTELSQTPVQFKMCVENIARQIAGVVAAIQAHDITRQQIEHVQEAFVLIAGIMPESSEDGGTSELAQVYAGLTIQAYQLRTIKETVANWATQIKTCMSGIMKVSTSEVAGIGPTILKQEREVSSQLGQIERLERESQAYSGRIQSNLGGLQNVMQLVSEHLQRSKFIGNRLRFVAFNSIIEASHLGTQADVILAISNSITEVSAEWKGVTDQSEQAMQQILQLVRQTNDVMKIFSEPSDKRSREAQMQNGNCIATLRTAAASAAQQAQDMKVVTVKMQARSTEAGGTVDLLEACFGRMDSVVTAIEELMRQLEIDHSGVKDGCDPAEIEQLFSASYSTEMERAVLQAALGGKTVPVAQPTFAGNSVELF